MAEAVSWVNQFFYRKEFGLSWEDYMKEPVSAFYANSFIISQIGKINEANRRRLARKLPGK